MNPARVDFLIDLAYGLLIFVSVVLLAVVGTRVGIAFGAGVLVSYVVHVVWKMARFDPEWMTEEVAAEVREAVSREVEAVAERVEEVNERVDRRPRVDEVDERVGEVDERVEEVNERVEKRPRTEEVDERVEELTDEKRSSDGRGR